MCSRTEVSSVSVAAMFRLICDIRSHCADSLHISNTASRATSLFLLCQPTLARCWDWHGTSS
jgi:hypothetical protein